MLHPRAAGPGGTLPGSRQAGGGAVLAADVMIVGKVTSYHTALLVWYLVVLQYWPSSIDTTNTVQYSTVLAIHCIVRIDSTYTYLILLFGSWRAPGWEAGGSLKL